MCKVTEKVSLQDLHKIHWGTTICRCIESNYFEIKLERKLFNSCQVARWRTTNVTTVGFTGNISRYQPKLQNI